MKPIPLTLHGSFSKSYPEMIKAQEYFSKSQIFEVIAPNFNKGGIIGHDKDGFAVCAEDLTESQLHDFNAGKLVLPELELGTNIQQNFLKKLYSLGREGVAYFVAPHHILGASATLELQFATSNQIRTIFSTQVKDPLLLFPENSVFSVEELIAYTLKHSQLPPPTYNTDWQKISSMPQVAYGAIVNETFSNELLFIRTGTRGSRGEKFTILGSTAKVGESQHDTLARAVNEHLCGTSYFDIGNHIATFSEKKGEYRTPQAERVFVDHNINITLPPDKLTDLVGQGKVFAMRLDNLLGSRSLGLLESNARETVLRYADLLRN